MAHNPAAALNVDVSNTKTSSSYDDRGDGTDDWLQYQRIADGGDVAQGLKADAAVTDPTAAATVIAALKGLLAGGQPTVPAHSMGVASLVVKASAGTLHSIVGTVAATADGYLQVHDATSLPSNGAVPEMTFPVFAASADQAVQLPFPGHVCATGIVVAWSTTRDTLTIGTSVLSLLCHYV